MALFHVGGHPFLAVLRGTEKDPVSFQPLVMSGGRHKINMNAIQKKTVKSPLKQGVFAKYCIIFKHKY